MLQNIINEVSIKFKMMSYSLGSKETIFLLLNTTLLGGIYVPYQD